MLFALQLIALISSLIFTMFSMQWLRLLIFGVACAAYLLLWCSFLYFNSYFTEMYNRRLPLRMLCGQLIESNCWKDLKLTLNHIYQYRFSHDAQKDYGYEPGLAFVK